MWYAYYLCKRKICCMIYHFLISFKHLLSLKVRVRLAKPFISISISKVILSKRLNHLPVHSLRLNKSGASSIQKTDIINQLVDHPKVAFIKLFYSGKLFRMGIEKSCVKTFYLLLNLI